MIPKDFGLLGKRDSTRDSMLREQCRSNKPQELFATARDTALNRKRVGRRLDRVEYTGYFSFVSRERNTFGEDIGQHQHMGGSKTFDLQPAGNGNPFVLVRFDQQFQTFFFDRG